MMKGEHFIQLKEFLFQEHILTSTYYTEFILPSHKNIPKTKDQNKKPVLKEQNGKLQNITYSNGNE